MFRGIHPRLAGIGAASVYSVYIITFYYTVIISWSVVYFVAGFASPLPWSEKNEDFVAKCDMNTMTRAEQFLMVDVIRFWDDNCKPYESGDSTLFSWKSFWAVTFVWICIFLCVFKGVKSSSYIVWVTVPVPALFVVIMVINGLQLDGAGDGIKQYLRGNENKFDGLTGAALEAAEEAEAKVQEGVWSDACGQIFFSIGVCIGVMTSYGRYNPVSKPIILDNFVIALSNSMLSFIAGFAVWSVVGYLQSLDSIAKSKTSSIGLAFIAYPTAIDSMSLPNLWAIILGLTLFMLGIDSAFSFIEAASTVICDTQWGKNYPRMFVAFVLCAFGYVLAIPFCTNWGFILFDVIDYYMSNTLLIMVGILQCFGCGWGFDAENTYRKSDNHAKSLLALGIGYWACLTILALVFVLIEKITIGLFVTAGVILLVVSPISFFVSKMSLKDWYNDIWMCGVRKLGYSMSMLQRGEDGKIKAWEPFFVFYFGFTIKFSTPVALMFIFINAIKRNVETPYGGYSNTFQVIGILVPIIGFLFFLYFVFFNVHEEPFDHSQFEEGLQEIEMSKMIKSGGAAAVVPAPTPVPIPVKENEKSVPGVGATPDLGGVAGGAALGTVGEEVAGLKGDMDRLMGRTGEGTDEISGIPSLVTKYKQVFSLSHCTIQ